MQELERTLARIHPNTLTRALTYAALVILLGILGSLAIRGAARRALLIYRPFQVGDRASGAGARRTGDGRGGKHLARLHGPYPYQNVVLKHRP
jgi:hypothetical protein